jgi:hypothetical protein
MRRSQEGRSAGGGGRERQNLHGDIGFAIKIHSPSSLNSDHKVTQTERQSEEREGRREGRSRTDSPNLTKLLNLEISFWVADEDLRRKGREGGGQVREIKERRNGYLGVAKLHLFSIQSRDL